MTRGLELRQVARALAEAVAQADGLRRCYPQVPSRIGELPAAYVSLPDRVVYNRRFGRGPVEATIPVTVVTGSVEADEAQLVMLDLVSNRPLVDGGHLSVKDAVEADRTLGGACSVCLVTEANDPRGITVAEATYLAIDLLVTVHA